MTPPSSPFSVRELLERGRGGCAAVIGGGVTGRAVARFLTRIDYRVTVLDERSVSDEIRRDLLARGDVTLRENFRVNELQEGDSWAFAVVSPGVDPQSSIVRVLGNVPLLSELDLAVAYLGMPLIAVTGTNGKSTTCCLIGAMLNAAGVEVQVVGNIGRPIIDSVVPRAQPRSGFAPLVVEVSSYQLDTVQHFAPHIAVWINLEENHLERHGTMEKYLRAKGRIFMGQRRAEDYSVIGSDDPRAPEMRVLCRGQVVPFGSGELAGGNGAQIQEDGVQCQIGGAREEFYTTRTTKLVGRHNRLNIAAALLAARLAGATPARCQDAIDAFRPLEHRLEFVRELRGVAFVNDSKATTVAASCAALDALHHESRKIVLLLGGQAKYGSWLPLAERAHRSCRKILCFGSDGEKIAGELASPERVGNEIVHYISLADALRAAAESARAGEVVLLSPGCASFDAYPNYEVRGRHFKELVHGLSEER